MANPLKGDVAFEAEGVEYVLRFDVEQIVALEDMLDKPINTIGVQMATGRVGVLRAALWAGLRVHQPKMTLKDVDALFLKLKGGKAMSLVGEALRRAFGEDETEVADGGAADPPTPAAGIGSGSSPNGAS